MSVTSHISAPGRSLTRTDVAAEFWERTVQGDVVNLYTLSNDVLKVTLSDYGARIVNVLAPDRNGRRDDVIITRLR